jgi:DNA-binding CsgD family transcriptional regulator
MDLGPDARLRSLAKPDSSRLDETVDLQLTDILRRRRCPVLMLIDSRGELVYSTVATDTGPGPQAQAMFSQAQIDAALTEARRPFQSQSASAPHGFTIDKPGERCSLITIGTDLYCVRVFALQDAGGARGALYAALVEAIGRPQREQMDAEGIKALFRLSRREMDVLGALMSGDTDKEIAQKLTVSVETVRAYLKSIRAKLRAKTRTAIVSIIHAVQTDRLNRGV